jgi:hypothetical protein
LVGWSVGPLVHPSACPHDEILRNLLTSKTVYVAIASRLGFGNNLVLRHVVAKFFFGIIFTVSASASGALSIGIGVG